MYRPLVHVIGDVMLDVDLRGTVNRQSPEAPSIPVVSCDQPIYHLGGAANVACLAAHRGADVVLFGAVGDDLHGQHLEALCIQQHIDALLDHSLTTTTTKYRVYADYEHLVRADVEKPQSVGGLIPRTVAPSDAIVLSDYAKGVFGEDARDEVQSLIQSATCPVVADVKPTPYIDIFSGATAITPNERELLEIGHLLGIERSTHVELAAAVKDRLGLGAVVVTMGAAGALCMWEKEFVFYPLATKHARPQVVGAGDAFVVALAWQLSAGKSLFAATKSANSAAHRYVGNERP